MLQSAVIAYYRSSARHPLYAALNLLGLSIGIAVFIVLSLFVRFETSYEQWVPHADAIYEVATLRRATPNGPSRRFSSAGFTLDAIRAEFPGQLGTRVATAYMIVHKGNESFDEEGQLVDPEVFQVFNIGWVAGDPATALRPDAILLSEAMARKYFGSTDIIGKTINLRDDLGPLTREGYVAPPPRDYVVTGVLKNPPANSRLRFDFVRLITPQRVSDELYWHDWGVSPHHTYLYVPSAETVHRINARTDLIIDKYGSSVQYDMVYKGEPRHKHIGLQLVPLTAEHLADRKTAAGVWSLAVVGVLALSVALINYINLATARAGLRAREVAVRKCVGATSGSIRLQFLTEALLVSLAAGLLGFSLVELLLPIVNRFGGLSLRLDYLREASLLSGLMGCVLSSGLLAGLYPAFVLSAFEPAQVLASTRSPSGGRLSHVVREALVVLQFTVVSAFFIIVIGFFVQLRHMETSDLGFRREGLLITTSTISDFVKPDQVEAIQAQWRALPNVVALTSGSVPGHYLLYGSLSVTTADPRIAPILVKSLTGERDFFRTYGTELLAGRSMDQADRIPMKYGPVGMFDDTVNVVVNKAMVQAMGLAKPQSAIGQILVCQLTRLRIVGVVQDQRFISPTEKMGPAIYFISEGTEGERATVLRFEGVSEEVMVARMKAVWHKRFPGLPLVTESSGDTLAEYYETDRRNTSLFAVGAGVAGLIGAIGLYGMAAFNTSSRAREIGLRKVMGASRGQVTRLLVLQFMMPVVIANLIAWPIAWFTLSRWLSQFDDRVAMSVWFFAAGSGASLLVAIVTVAGLALSSAGASPGKTLRHS